MRRIYLDHNATTPLDPRVAEAMAPWLGPRCGNPSSLHAEGRAARRAVEGARESLAEILGARPTEIVFTSGATEANATVLAPGAVGSANAWAASAVEHASVREPLAVRAAAGARVTTLAVDGEGRLRLDALDAALTRPLDGVALMGANNETGALQPVAEAAAKCGARGVGLHVDAAQMLGKAAIRVDAAGFDGVTSMVFSAHKCGGPAGVGALWVRRGHAVRPLFVGGGQERDRRAGTENTAGVVGFACAARLAAEELAARRAARAAAEAAFLAALTAAGLPWARHGPRDADLRLPGTLCLRIPGRSGEGIVLGLDLAGTAVGLGAACSSGAATPSHVLEAMGIPRAETLESFRVSFGAAASVGEAEAAAAALIQLVQATAGPRGPSAAR